MAVDTATDQLAVRLLHPDAQAPERTRPGDAGFDLRSVEPFTLAPGERQLVPTGVAIALPPNHAGLVTPRSGLAIKHGISVVNGPGLVDPNYRGELKVVLINLGDEAFHGNAGDRIAQLLIVPFAAPAITIVDALEATERGDAGFGSSGR
jgi:dUTP pyrophosphatase